VFSVIPPPLLKGMKVWEVILDVHLSYFLVIAKFFLSLFNKKMSLHSRQLCSSRSVFRVTLASIVVLVVLLIYRSLIPKNNYCNTSTDCYNLIKEKARLFRESTASTFGESFQSGLLPDQQIKEQDETRATTFKESQGKKVAGMPMDGEPNAAVAEANVDFDLFELSDEEMSSPTPTAEELEYQKLTDASLPRVKGAFVVLVRNSEVYALRSSMRYLEDRFNHKYNYPYIFLNEEPFTEEFKNMTGMMTNAEVTYGLVPKEHWSYPDWIDQEYAAQCRQDLADRDIVYGGSESYRHMCRYQSGFFMLHPLLDDYDYYW
jgi:hypothetical protein